ncbi:YitT family protein [Oceanobacillus alkalisoli]|uniref:YitT family protein n=1 Tax=Oceanobacillus alkalisoli TaxID=2925113 RepID=UPI001EE4D5B2|nr:YitT family protein [Oceanobacillus alkalisoli]MCG5101990.1 YitT family protein [Oceanobacillus alkalisoli]
MFMMEAKRIITVIIGAFLLAVSLNFFLITANVYASGFAGAAQLLSSVFQDFLGMNIGTGIFLLLLNIPVFILGWFKVGKGFTIYSGISVVFSTIFLEFMPIIALSNDIMLNAVFGGVIAGAGIGISLKIGASTGGMDIIAMLLSRMNDKPVGTYLMALNGIIILLAGVLYSAENALYTLIALYATTKIIDMIHTRHVKLTAMIITQKPEEMQQAIHNRFIRGITFLPAQGAYSKIEKKMVYLVLNRYELYDVEKIIKEVDPEAFTNVVETTAVYGYFRKD